MNAPEAEETSINARCEDRNNVRTHNINGILSPLFAFTRCGWLLKPTCVLSLSRHILVVAIHIPREYSSEYLCTIYVQYVFSATIQTQPNQISSAETNGTYRSAHDVSGRFDTRCFMSGRMRRGMSRIAKFDRRLASARCQFQELEPGGERQCLQRLNISGSKGMSLKRELVRIN